MTNKMTGNAANPSAIRWPGQPNQSAMHFDHGERVALAIDAQRSAHPIDFFGRREIAGRQL